HRVGRVVVVWGRAWPPAPRPNVHPPARPVKILRASRYVVQASNNRRNWRTVATVTTASNRTTDTMRFAAVGARYLRIRIATATNKSTPLLQELTATG
ncbi:MAG: discoidin domain-containing protein, partial [Actinomycetota bacterium]|nr:discoidin domain-containing protein [Actinomycetota bacterium]